MSTTLFFIFLTLSSISAINIKKITQTNKYCIPEAENILDEQPTCYFRCESFKKLSQKLKDSKCIEKSCINSCCLCPRECLTSCKFEKSDSQYKNPYFYNQKCVNNCCERKNDWTDKYIEKKETTNKRLLLIIVVVISYNKLDVKYFCFLRESKCTFFYNSINKRFISRRKKESI